MNLKILVALCLALVCAAPAFASTRQQKIRIRSEQVMPFSMDATAHTFTPTATGGVMAVSVRAKDATQLSLVRSHLRREAQNFARGDYSDPARIHGRNMPGLSDLSVGARRVIVRYSETPAGASITFVTGDPKLVSALHRWFAAQVADHGHDAMMH